MAAPVDLNPREFTTQMLRQAARETGTDFNYLVDTAARESNFDPDARARTSSAAGMFQFIEQTWLGVMERHGAKHGHAELAQSINRDASGRLTVSDPAERARILDLRFDPELSARMAGELASENAAVIEQRLGRPPSGGELYVAHFLGANGAAGLIAAAERSPQTRADQLFPQAAQANRPIFYDGGRARSAADVLAVLTGEPARTAPAAQQNMRAPASPSPVRYDGPINPGSFRTGSGELSPALVEILASLDAPDAGRSRET